MAGGVVVLIASTLPQLMPQFDTELVQQVCASIVFVCLGHTQSVVSYFNSSGCFHLSKA